MKSQIHLIRHGITEGNQRKLFYGASDVALADEGIQELREQVAEGIYPDAENSDFYTSGLKRTEQTLALIYGDVEHERIPELQEMNFGEYEMKTYRELKEKPEFHEWYNDKTQTLAPPGGESIGQFTERIIRGFKILMGKHQLKELSVRHNGAPATSTVVCHGGVISAIMETIFPNTYEHFYRWIPDPGHGYTLTVENGEITGYDKF